MTKDVDSGDIYNLFNKFTGKCHCPRCSKTCEVKADFVGTIKLAAENLAIGTTCVITDLLGSATMLRTRQNTRAKHFRVICVINGFKLNAVYKFTILNTMDRSEYEI